MLLRELKNQALYMMMVCAKGPLKPEVPVKACRPAWE